MQAEEPRAEYLFDLGGQFHHWRETLHRYTAREISPTDHFWEFIRPARIGTRVIGPLVGRAFGALIKGIFGRR